MKTLKRKSEVRKNLEAQSKEKPADPGKPKILHTENGIAKQYPEKPGYHGTDDEKTLNPEE